MKSANCPYCNTQISLPLTPKIGQLVKCTKCKSQLEVVWLEPFELDWPFELDDEDQDDSVEENSTEGFN